MFKDIEQEDRGTRVDPTHRYICLECKFSAKGMHHCPNCRVLMADFGYKARVPKKNNKGGWKALFRLFSYRIYLHNRRYGTAYPHSMKLRNGTEHYWNALPALVKRK